MRSLHKVSTAQILTEYSFLHEHTEGRWHSEITMPKVTPLHLATGAEQSFHSILLRGRHIDRPHSIGQAAKVILSHFKMYELHCCVYI